MRILVFIMSLMGGLLLQAQNVMITGQLENQPDKLIRIKSYADCFSLLEKTLQSTFTDRNGYFTQEIEFSNNHLVLIAVDLKQTELFVESDESYNLLFKEDSLQDVGSIFEQSPLSYDYVDYGGLNARIHKFNVLYNTFLLDNFNTIYRSRSNSIINAFRLDVDSIFHDYNNTYFNNYTKYKIASLEFGSRRKKENKMLEDYFLNTEILYDNIEYAGLFKETFDSYFTSGQSNIDYSELLDIINYSSNFKLIDKLISESNHLLADDQRLRELIAIVGLSKLFKTNGFDANNIIKYLRQIERNSSFSEHREIAGNYIIKFEKLAYGSVAPDFTLLDLKANSFSLSDVKGNFVLMGFLQSNNGICISQIPIIDELRQMFNGKLQILSLVNGDLTEIGKYMYERDYEWPVLNIDDILLLEAYDIKVFPTYVLLNPDGSIAMAPTPMPDESLQILINGFMKRWESSMQNDK